jgi:DNA-binding NtrC family response regulator
LDEAIGVEGVEYADNSAGCRPLRMTYREAMRQAREQYLRALLDESQGNVTRAARIAGLRRTSLHRMLASTRPAAPVNREGNDEWQGLEC